MYQLTHILIINILTNYEVLSLQVYECAMCDINYVTMWCWYPSRQKLGKTGHYLVCCMYKPEYNLSLLLRR